MHGPSAAQDSLFHFRVFTNGVQIHESDPLSFDNINGVWHEGAMSSCELIQAMHGRVEPGLDWLLEVTDADGNTIFRFSFKAENVRRLSFERTPL